MTLNDDAQLATRLVTEAVGLAAAMRSAGLQVSSKTSISDVVTDADHAAEKLIVDTLAVERPDDGLLGEEGAAAEGTSGRRWVIDPVDGTYNFSVGSDYWCSALALVDADGPILGAVAHHASGSVVVGGPNLPTTRNGEPVAPRDDVELATLSVATYLHPRGIDTPQVSGPFLRAARLPATLRMLGSGSMDLVGVATGRVGAWFQHSTPDWDWYPGAAILAGAGLATDRIEVDGLRWSVAGPPTAVATLAGALRGDA